VNAAIFLPRCQSKIVLALVLASYSFTLEQLILAIVHIFTPIRQPGSILAAHGIVGEAADYLVFAPIVAVAVLIGSIELLRLLRFPVILQIALATLGSCAINAIYWRPWGIVVAPLFLISSYAYLLWRPESWIAAFAYTVLIHASSNLAPAINALTHATRRA
jgi:hypothetical protein